MTLLPIIERELRVQARGRGNYWARTSVAAVGLLACLPPLVWSGPFAAPGSTGRAAFNGLVIAAFLLCCAACLVTADTISSERREGTLGLLFLTRVNHLDVLLGKFGSRGLACLLATAAFVPVLALPLLAGGVTGAEAARVALGLLNTLFLALSVGLWASARGVERYRTVRAALLVLTALVLAPGLLGMPGWLASPAGTLSQAFDVTYRTSPGRYWLSLGLVQAFAWALLGWAAISLRNRATQVEEQTRARRSRSEEEWSITHRRTTCRYCGRQNPTAAVHCRECGTALHPRPPSNAPSLSVSPSPMHWLLRRQHGLSPMIWLAAAIGFFHFALYGIGGRFFGFSAAAFTIGIYWIFGLVDSVVTGAIFAWASSRFFIEGRRTGELELLLTTPVGAGQIVTAQWDVIKRLVTLPLVVMLLPWLLQCVVMFSLAFPPQPDPWRVYYLASFGLAAINTVFSVGACCWLALWFGFSGATQWRTMLWSVLLAKGVPFVLTFIWSIFQRYLVAVIMGPFNTWRNMPLLLGSLLPQLATLLISWWLIRVARRELLRSPAEVEPVAPRQLLARALLRFSTAIRRSRQWPPVS